MASEIRACLEQLDHFIDVRRCHSIELSNGELFSRKSAGRSSSNYQQIMRIQFVKKIELAQVGNFSREQGKGHQHPQTAHWHLQRGLRGCNTIVIVPGARKLSQFAEFFSLEEDIYPRR